MSNVDEITSLLAKESKQEDEKPTRSKEEVIADSVTEFLSATSPVVAAATEKIGTFFNNLLSPDDEM